MRFQDRPDRLPLLVGDHSDLDHSCPRTLCVGDQVGVGAVDQRGVKTDARLEENMHTLRRRRAFAECMQETWRVGAEEFELCGFLFIGIGPEQPNDWRTYNKAYGRL